jgi:adenosylcobinamide kinase/adenosylcobinamide-phosphate guanylyltransferase
VLILITGPVRSGKSRFAESRAARSGGTVTYVATAAHIDDDIEWSARLAHHLDRRPPNWTTIETAGMEATAIEDLIRKAPANTTMIIDSLGTWLADQMQRISVDDIGAAMTHLDLLADCLADACIASRARLIVVGEEVGWGIVPDVPSGRLFRDVLGRLQQRLARAARQAYVVISGYAIDLKTNGLPVNPIRRRQSK